MRFARNLADYAAKYAIEVERAWRGLPTLTTTALVTCDGPGR